MRFAIVNGLPGVIVDAPEGTMQTAAIEIEGGVIRAMYVVRNPDKLRHLAAARRDGTMNRSTSHEQTHDL
jgi:RNA polymerase sigma-70 factor (ECF subfamily)